jgi:CubicO group peptidase (beta-lactamase class C family)
MNRLLVPMVFLITCCGIDDAVEVQDELDELVGARIAANEFLGLGVSVRTEDGWPAFAAAGHSDPAAQVEYDVDDTEQVIGSVTKLYTAVLVMQLAEEDRVSLDDRVDGYISFPGADEITVRMLLNHTSGLNDYLNHIPPEQLGQRWTPPQLIEVALAAGPMGAPGMEKAIYSNTNFLLLAMIVEAETGKSWEDNIQERIAEPLGLDHTYFAGESDRAANMVGGWVQTPDGWLDTLTLFDSSIGYAMGGMVSTNAELLVFTAALFDGELFDSSATLAQMMSFDTEFDPAYQQPGEPPSRIGLAMMSMEIDGIVLEGHLGHIEGFNAAALRDPVTDEIIVVTSNDNRAWAGPIATEVARTLRDR